MSACRLPDLYAVTRGIDVSPALSSGLSRPLGLPADFQPPSRRNSAQLSNLSSPPGQPGQLGSPLGQHPEQHERGYPAFKLESSGAHEKVHIYFFTCRLNHWATCEPLLLLSPGPT